SLAEGPSLRTGPGRRETPGREGSAALPFAFDVLQERRGDVPGRIGSRHAGVAHLPDGPPLAERGCNEIIEPLVDDRIGPDQPRDLVGGAAARDELAPGGH